ncbi:hypothetical protein [Tardiphaga sp. 11_C7_N12_6]|uniref:hypothetical protein n=1 Tax=Tardiphaga sp. 11_C7_N12_6 TaxID=3240789 RepID=UPI003F228953
MSRNSSISSSDMQRLSVRLLLPILVVIASIALLDAMLTRAGLQPRLFGWGKTFDDYDVVYSSAVQAKKSGKKIIAFIGDSRIEWGLDPYAVQDAVDKAGLQNYDVFNLAIPGRNVRTMLMRLNEVGFFPDVLVVGYSHLSFYWSKNFVTQKPNELSWWKSDRNRFNSFVERKVLASPFGASEIWRVLFNDMKITGASLASWLDRVDVTPRGQALVHYRLAESEAIEFQKTFYKDMYSVTMTNKMVEETNASFLKDLSIQQAHGTKAMLLKMPLSDWALDLERANERSGLDELSRYLHVPYFDGNEMPGSRELKTFDGLHLQPASATSFSSWIMRNIIIPRLTDSSAKAPKGAS